MNEAISSGAQRPKLGVETERSHTNLFVGMGVAMLLVLLIGFGPTFFFRPFFQVPAISPFLYLHGVLMVAWFGMFLIQATLARRGSVGLHRKLGSVGVIIGVSALATAVIATFNSFASGSISSRIFWGNTGAYLAFSVFLFLAVCYRKQPYVHRRMMLFGSISWIGPAFGRMSTWPIADGLNLSVFNTTAISLLVLAVVVHELVVDRRVHLLTVLAILGLYTMRILFTRIIPASDTGMTIAGFIAPT